MTLSPVRVVSPQYVSSQAAPVGGPSSLSERGDAGGRESRARRPPGTVFASD